MSKLFTWLNQNTPWGQLSNGAKRNVILSLVAIFFMYGGYHFIFAVSSNNAQTIRHNKVLKHVLTGKTYVPKPADLLDKEKKNEASIRKASQKLSKLEQSMVQSQGESKEKLAALEAKIADVVTELKSLLKKKQVNAKEEVGSTVQAGETHVSLPPESKRDPKIYTYFELDPKARKQQAQDDFDQAVNSILPAGSLITGVLLTGMDAPTVSVAKAQWMPALVRIKKSAILPNYHRMNLRECFLLGTGFGDLSSERAKIRSTYLSCIRYDGEVLQTKINAVAIGEDAKVGLRGKVVTRNGALIARAALAGFFGGFGKSLQPSQIPQINIGSGSTQQFGGSTMHDILKVGALGGASSSLDRVTKFYMDMAEQIFPVIEISAGREITFLVNAQGIIQSQSHKKTKDKKE